MQAQKEVILTGIRSNSIPTLGNYLGAFLPMVELQRKYAGDYQVNMFVPDLHSFTTPVDHDNLYQNSIQNLKFFIAAGLDIENSDTYIYRQSYIPAHSELMWILSCFARIGELNRMTQFKEKVGIQDVDRALEKLHAYANSDSVSVDTLKEYADEAWSANNQEASATSGLYMYPVLMAADILLYGARYVPVGEDQRQHLELARDLGQRMNNKFGELFTVPENWQKQLEFAQRDNGVRIRSLVNPEKKMSKSISDPRGTILLTDDPKDAAKKVMGATTDSFGEVKFDLKERPGISNLLQMLALLTERPLAEAIAEWEGKTSYGELKKAVATAVEAFLTNFQSKYNAVDEQKLMAKLEQDEAAMREVSSSTLYKVQQAVGLRPRE